MTTGEQPAPSVEQSRNNESAAAPAGTPADRWSWRAWLNWLPWIWLGGAGFALIPLALGWLSLWQLRRTAQPVTASGGGPWRTLLHQLEDQIGLRRPVLLLQSPCRTMPMTWGGGLAGWLPGPWGKAKVLIPEDASDWSLQRRRAVLLHELAHIKRYDCLTQVLTQVACAVYWFNPLVWYAAHRMLIERERACDDLVLTHETKASDYAQHLLDIATGPQASFFAGHAGIAMARRSKLDGRLVAILDQHRNRRAMTRLGVVLTITLIGAVAVPVACVRVAQQADTAAETEVIADSDTGSTVEPQAFTVELSNDVTVALVAMAERHRDLHRDPAQWWTAAGEPITPDLVNHTFGGVPAVAENHVVRTIVIRLTGFVGEAPGFAIEGDGAEQYDVFDYRRQGVVEIACTASFPRDQSATDLRLGIATGPWQTIIENVPAREGGSGTAHGQTVKIGSVAIGESAFAGITYDWPPKSKQIEVISSGTGRLGAAVKVVMTDPNTSHRVAAFWPPPGDSQGMQDLFDSRLSLRTRDYHWVEFRNVSLQPGHETEVEVVVEPAPAEDATGDSDAADRLGIDSEVEVRVFELIRPGEHHVQQYEVDAAGRIHLPAGPVDAVGLTAGELEDRIAEGLAEQRILRDADVRVRLVEVGDAERDPEAATPQQDHAEAALSPLVVDVHEGRMRLRDRSVTVIVGDGYVEVTDPIRNSRQARFQSGARYRFTADEGRVILDSPTGPATIHLREGKLRLRSDEREITADRLELQAGDGRWRVRAVDGEAADAALPERIDPLRDTVASRQRQFERVQLQAEAGRVSPDEVEQAREALIEARLALAEAEAGQVRPQNVGHNNRAASDGLVYLLEQRGLGEEHRDVQELDRRIEELEAEIKRRDAEAWGQAGARDVDRQAAEDDRAPTGTVVAAANEGALDGWISAEEKARISALPEHELAELIRTGIRGQREKAAAVLEARGRGEALLDLAKEGPRAASEIIIEGYVPQATPESGAGDKARVDAYLAWLEEQVVSDSPVVTPTQAVRSLGRVAYRRASEGGLPRNGTPEPRYQHQRVVSDLISLLDDSRPTVSDAAAHWLGNIGGYAAEHYEEAVAALTAYRRSVAAEPVTDDREKRRRLYHIDRAIKRVNAWQDRETEENFSPLTRPDPGTSR